MKVEGVTVRIKATELDVYINGVRIGRVIDCGDCWRASMTRTPPPGIHAGL